MCFLLRRSVCKCSWLSVVSFHLNPSCPVQSLWGFFKPLSHPPHGRVGNHHQSTDMVGCLWQTVLLGLFPDLPAYAPLLPGPDLSCHLSCCAAFHVAVKGLLGWQRAAAVALLLPVLGNCTGKYLFWRAFACFLHLAVVAVFRSSKQVRVK